MGVRRKGREAAFQLVYQLDLSGIPYQDAAGEFWAQMGVPKEARDFALNLVSGTIENMKDIDEMISRHSHHWKIHRMNSVDKSILRIGVFELMLCKDTPTKVIINEAIEIGKKYGTSESGAFINGILDKISKEVRGDDSK